MKPALPRALVIGAGPGGGVAAIVLARMLGPGSTLIVDRSGWPRNKVCGCCVGRAGVEMLDRLAGADSRPVDRGRVQGLRAVAIRVGGHVATIPHAGGVAMSRAELDEAIVQRAEAAGAGFLSRTSARVIRRENGAWIVRLSRVGETPWEQAFGLVIVADGIGGSSLSEIGELRARVNGRSRIGAGTILVSSETAPPPGIVAMHIGAGGYVGLVRLGDGRVAVGAALDPDATRAAGGPHSLINAILESCGEASIPLHATSDEPAALRFAGTGLLTRSRPRLALPGMLIIGDAAGYVEPFTGEGMTWAIASGSRAAELGAEALCRGTLDRLETLWPGEHARLIGRRQIACRAVRWIAHRPRAARVLVGAIARYGAVAGAARALGESLGRGYPGAAGPDAIATARDARP